MVVDDQPGQPGAVERTAVWVALKKAIVASRHLPLVHDPVILAMAPPSPQLDAWQQAELERLQTRAEGGGAGSGCCPPKAGEEDHDSDTQALMTLALRCRYIDDELLSLIHSMRRWLMLEGGAGAASHAGRSGGNRPSIQVVLLGAGLDTRPWRLPLGRDIRWFEVDLPDMTACKRSWMERAGMQGVETGQGGTGAARGSGSACEAPTSSPRFPLHVASWVSLSADLSRLGWLGELQRAGWQPEGPTVWVVEGVLYYLSQQGADRLIQDVTGVCKAGKVGALIVSTCTPAMICAINAVKGEPEGEGSTAGKASPRWWFQDNFPNYEATLGEDPSLTLRQAGWGAAYAVSTSQLEPMYDARRSTRILPAAAEQDAVKSCGGGPALYQIATATLGLG